MTIWTTVEKFFRFRNLTENHFNCLNRKQGIRTDKIPVIFYNEKVNNTKVLDTCQEHVQDNSEQSNIETKVEESFQTWLPL